MMNVNSHNLATKLQRTHKIMLNRNFVNFARFQFTFQLAINKFFQKIAYTLQLSTNYI